MARTKGQVALGELAEKSLRDIQRETAIKWAGRSWAASVCARKARSLARRRAWASDAKEYAHEAIEHGALAVWLGEPEHFLSEVLGFLRGRRILEPSVASATAELKRKTLHEIQRETAVTWGWRAWAAVDYAQRCRTPARRRRWMDDAHEYAHEALEHAALSEDNDGFEDEIRRLVAAAL